MSLSLFAQSEKSFEKGVSIIEPRIGLGLYKVTVTDTNNVSNHDSAGAVLYQAGYEYGILNWLGAGGKFNYSHYINNDSGSTQKGSGLDFAVLVRAHALRTKHIDMFAGLDFGYSHFALDANNGSGAYARAGGTYFGFNLNSRFYFGKMWGLNLFYNFDSYHYPHGIVSDNTTNTYEFDWKAKSFFLLGAGLQFKL